MSSQGLADLLDRGASLLLAGPQDRTEGALGPRSPPSGCRAEQNRATRYDYDLLGRQTVVTQAWAETGDETAANARLNHASPVTTREFDAADNLVKLVNSRGVETEYAYDYLNRQTETREATAFNVSADLPALTHAIPVTKVEYDGVDNVTRVEDAEGTVTVTFYDEHDRAVQVYEAWNTDDQRLTTLAYDAADNMVAEARGQVTNLPGTAVYTGNLPELVLHTEYQFDALNRRVKVLEGAHLSDDAIAAKYNHRRPTTTFKYDAVGNTIEVRTAESLTKLAYDYLDQRTVVVEGENQPSESRVVASYYDAAGNVIRTWDAQNIQTQYDYDALNRRVSTLVGMNLPTEERLTTALVLNAFDQVVEQQTDLGTTKYEYDRLGRQRKLIQANSHETAFTYDALGNRLAVKDKVTGRWTEQRTVHLELVGPLTVPIPHSFSYTDTTASQYDALNRVVKITDPNGKDTIQEYDTVGRVIETTDRNGRVKEYDYDRLNRMAWETWYEGASVVSLRGFEFDSVDNFLSSEVLLEQWGLRHERTYDDFGRVETDAQYLPGPNGSSLPVSLTFHYDAAHRVVGVGDSEGGLIRSTYDAANRLTQRQWLDATAGRDAIADRKVRWFYRDDTALAEGAEGKLDQVEARHVSHRDTGRDVLHLWTNYAYDALSRQREMVARTGSTVFERMEHAYNPEGLVQREERQSSTDTASLDVSAVRTFQYDDRGQVVEEAVEGAGEPRKPKYDDNGNPIQHAPPQPGNRVSKTAGGFHLVHDDEGNVVEMHTPLEQSATGGSTFARLHLKYDHANRLVEVQTERWFSPQSDAAVSVATKQLDLAPWYFDYDAEGRLVQVRTAHQAAQQFAHRGRQVWGDFRAGQTAALLRRYLHSDRIDELLARQDVGQEGRPTFWHLTDRQQSVLQVVRDVGGALSTALGISYFNKQGRTGPAGLVGRLPGHRYGYTGREQFSIGTMFLQHNRARFFAPELGRWLSEDPIGFSGGDTNLYRYVGNSHPNFTDPSGEVISWLGAAAGAVVGAVVGAATHVAVSAITGRELTWGGFVGAAVAGAGTGALVGAYAGAATGDFTAAAALTALGVGFGSFAAGSVVEQGIDRGLIEVEYGRAAGEGLAGAVLTLGTVGGASAFARGLIQAAKGGAKGAIRQGVQRFLAGQAAKATVAAGHGYLDARARGYSHGQSLVAGAQRGIFGALDPTLTTYTSATGAAVGHGLGQWLGGSQGANLGRSLGDLGGGLLGGFLVGRRLSQEARSLAPPGALGDSVWLGGLIGAHSKVGLRMAALDAGGALGGGVIGYVASGGSLDAAFQYAAYGMIGTGLAVQASPQLQRALLKACFAAGTPLLTPEGSRAIEDFRPGDLVLSRDENNPDGPVVAKVVEEVFVRTGFILHVHIGGQVIRTTAEHPFYVKGKGWTAANDLEAGDLISSHCGGWTGVEEVYHTGLAETVYNLRVAEYHTYFVGCEAWGWSVWAHNTCLTEAEKQVIAFGYQRWRISNPTARKSEFFDQVTHPRTQEAITGRQIRSIVEIANNDPNWTRPPGMRGRKVAADPVEDQRQNLAIADETARLQKLGHVIKNGGRVIDENGIPVKLLPEKQLADVGRTPDITAFGPVDVHGNPLPIGEAIHAEWVTHHVNVGANTAKRLPSIEERGPLNQMREAGHLVRFIGFGQRKRK